MTVRKTSAFAAMESPIEPPAVKAKESKGSTESQQASKVAAPSAQPDAPVQASKSDRGDQPAKEKKEKRNFYMLPSEEARSRAAWMHTMGHTQHLSVTSFYEAAIASYTRELEKLYNDSKPFN